MTRDPAQAAETSAGRCRQGQYVLRGLYRWLEVSRKPVDGASASRAALLAAVGLASILAGATSSSGLAASPTDARVTWNRTPADVRMVNYFPATHAWSAMWTHWNPITLERDFSRIAAVHANTVSITLFPEITGFPIADDVSRGHLERVLQFASARGLRVGLRLFDWWATYSDVAGSKAWIDSLLTDHANDGRIAFVELKDEIPVDDPSAIDWARAMVPYTQGILGGIPVTLSVSDAAGPTGLEHLAHALASCSPDFYTFNYFHSGAGELAGSILDDARRAVAPVPLFIGSTGFSTARSSTQVAGLARDAVTRNAYQAQYLRSVELATERLGLGMAAPWTLNDFSAEAIPGKRESPLEYRFGLSHAALRALTSVFGGAGVNLAFNNGFEQTTDAAASGEEPLLWRRFHTSDGTFGADRSVHHNGDVSARLSATRGWPSFYISPVDAAVGPGNRCALRAWARGQDATGETRILIAWFDERSRWLGQVTSATLRVGSSSWTQLSVTGTAPPQAAFVQLHLQSANNAGSAWFDDVKFSCTSS